MAEVDPSKLHLRGFSSKKKKKLYDATKDTRPATGPKNRDALPKKASTAPKRKAATGVTQASPAKRKAATGVTQPSPEKRKAATGYTHTASEAKRKAATGYTHTTSTKKPTTSIPKPAPAKKKEAPAKSTAPAKAKPVSQGNWNTGGAKTEKKNGYQYRATTQVAQRIKTRNK